MKTVKNLLKTACIMMLMFIATNLPAQQRFTTEQKKDKIEAQRAAFITEKLKATAEESQKFWPVYNEYDTQKEELNKTYRQTAKKYKNVELTDTQADSLIIADIEHDQALLDLKKSYIAKFKAVLPAGKVAQLADAEREFRRALLKMIKGQKRGSYQK